MKNPPLLTIITPTLNNESMLDDFLKTIKNQDLPAKSYEHLIVDGGSKDNTLKIAQKYHTKILKNKKVLAEYAVTLGMKKARGNLLMILAVDNFLEQKNALSTIIDIFKNKKIYAAFPKQDSDSSDSIWSWYANTFTDPFSHFVYGDAANSRTFSKIYKTEFSNSVFDIYDYNSHKNLPMIAFAQGFVLRASFDRDDADEADDCMPIVRMIRKQKKIAYIHSISVYHHTINNLRHFIKKQRWASLNALSNKNYGVSHRVHYLSPQQRFRKKIWPLYALSIIFPSFYAGYYLFRDREALWLMHPLMCFISALSSIYAVLLIVTGRTKISRQ